MRRFFSTLYRIMSQPAWNQAAYEEKPVLKLYNSLTRTKVPFHPQNPYEVTWYNCGPTVYNPTHLGHARNYVTVDINRRILANFFHYNVKFIQNVTDIDDKIILKARQDYLFDNFKSQFAQVSPDLVSEAEECWKEYVSDNLKGFTGESAKELETFAEKLTVEEKTSNPKLNMYVKAAKMSKEAIENPGALETFFESTKDVIVPVLDRKLGSTVTDPTIFKKTSTYWETQFDNDMAKLNVLPSTVTTRVSEYVPEIVEFVEEIIRKGYGYATDAGDVYFNTARFDQSADHDYAKLQPWSKSDTALLQEGEGSLSSSQGKRHNADFALWKTSKPGEPFWDSPWGQGRPGWHIECSVMASDFVSDHLDIHSGGIDLAFPHHDNEIAQSEAHFDCKQWVDYFLHTGHLHIEGQKMSKSLKNFITVEEALAKFSSRQLRLCFAMVQWNNQLDFKESLLQEVKSVESTFSKFFQNVRALNGDVVARTESGEIISKKLTSAEKALLDNLSETEKQVYLAFCDNLSTPQVMKLLLELVASSNAYISAIGKELRIEVLKQVVFYVTRILGVIGFDSRPDNLGWIQSTEEGTPSTSREELAMPFVKVLSTFRDFVRSSAMDKLDYSVFLEATDRLRNQDLLDLGVSLDDRKGQAALVKFLTKEEKETLVQQQQEKEKALEEKAAKKAAAQNAKLAKEKERRDKAKMSPLEMFKTEEYQKLYKEWDESGMPTVDVQGVEVTKSAKKKLAKLYEQQKKLHEEFKGVE